MHTCNFFQWKWIKYVLMLQNQNRGFQKNPLKTLHHRKNRMNQVFSVLDSIFCGNRTVLRKAFGCGSAVFVLKPNFNKHALNLRFTHQFRRTGEKQLRFLISGQLKSFRVPQTKERFCNSCLGNGITKAKQPTPTHQTRHCRAGYGLVPIFEAIPKFHGEKLSLVVLLFWNWPKDLYPQ